MTQHKEYPNKPKSRYSIILIAYLCQETKQYPSVLTGMPVINNYLNRTDTSETCITSFLLDKTVIFLVCYTLSSGKRTEVHLYKNIYLRGFYV